jgi:hypothetical protein
MGQPLSSIKEARESDIFKAAGLGLQFMFNKKHIHKLH